MLLVKEIVKFAIEWLVFQNGLLNGAHSIWYIKLPWFYNDTPEKNSSLNSHSNEPWINEWSS